MGLCGLINSEWGVVLACVGALVGSNVDAPVRTIGRRIRCARSFSLRGRWQQVGQGVRVQVSVRASHSCSNHFQIGFQRA